MLPTPTAGDAKSSGSRNKPGSKAHAGVSLTDAVLVGDSTTGHSRGKSGRLNPTWVESYLMGWPIGWTDCEPLAMARFHEWQQQHSSCCELAVDGEPEPTFEWARVRCTLNRKAVERAARLAAGGWETIVLRDMRLDGSPALGFQVLARREIR